MKITHSKILALFLLSLLAGCVAANGPTETHTDVDLLQKQLLVLPGAVVDLSTLTLTYPDEVLFASGSVLPFPGGMEVVAPLISWMLQDAEIFGEATVRSSGHTIDYDRTLAEKRLELLERLFKNRGVGSNRLKLSIDESAGAPLEIRFHLRRAATSVGVKS